MNENFKNQHESVRGTGEFLKPIEKEIYAINDYLQRNGHPHMKLMIDRASVEVVEGTCAMPFGLYD